MTLGSCAGGRPHGRAPARLEGAAARLAPGRIIRMETGAEVSFDEMVAELRTKDLVFIGEVHTDPDHHLIQVQLLLALLDSAAPAGLAMEFFQQPQQAVLDRYLDGSLSEAAFLEQVDWQRNWGYDYRFYRPLLLLARQRGARVFAVNAPREVIRKVARQGLAALSVEERGSLAGHIDLTRERHREYVRSAYAGHGHENLPEFENFYQAQCAWEDTMAENAVRHLVETGRQLILLAGNGHIVHGFGIPDRVRARENVSVATVVPLRVPGPVTPEKDLADFVWLTGRHRGLMENAR